MEGWISTKKLTDALRFFLDLGKKAYGFFTDLGKKFHGFCTDFVRV